MRWFATCAVVWCLAPALGAQGRPIVVRVQVIDSARAPVAGAAITIANGISNVLAASETDAAGRQTLRLESAPASFEVIVRKIGYGRSSQFVTAARDTIRIAVTLRRTVQALDAVQIRAALDPKTRSYHVDADEIANSTRPILDGLDVLTKLKPDILYGRSPGCGVRDVFVNGRRIVYPLPNAMAIARRGIAPDPRMQTQSRRPPLQAPLIGVSADVVSIMAEIRPEHIEEMTFEDCFSTKVEGLHTSSALFVVLKPGIGFEDVRGSYVIDDRSAKRGPSSAASGSESGTGSGSESGSETAFVASAAAAPTPLWRARLVGVYDASTGDPIDSVAVIDSLSGTTARTSPTGTVSLLFLPEGGSTLRLVKPGYADLRLDVTISPRDTVPITLVMTKRD